MSCFLIEFVPPNSILQRLPQKKIVWYFIQREWQLRRGNSRRKSLWSGKSTYFVGIFGGWCQVAARTYLLKHHYSPRKDWVAFSCQRGVSHFLGGLFSHFLSLIPFPNPPLAGSLFHSRASQWECWLKIHAQKVSEKPFVSFLPGPVRMVPMWEGGGATKPMGKSKSGCDQVPATLFIHFTHWSG